MRPGFQGLSPARPGLGGTDTVQCAGSDRDMTVGPDEPTQFSVEEVSPTYWRVTFENGPVNLLDVASIKELAALVTRIEESPTVTVVVFDSANPEYFMAHWDLRAD